jgi:acetyl esterase/lipase
MDAAQPARSAPPQGNGGGRWSYLPIQEWVYKETPQGELRVVVQFPFDWRPEDRRPGIVFFFGGGFVGGAMAHFARQAAYLAGRGMVAVRADYRVKERHGTPVRTCVEDARSAVRWLRANAAPLGLDPGRLATSGGSAGGYLALAAHLAQDVNGEGDDLAISPRPDAMVLFNPVVEIPEHVDLRRRLDLEGWISPVEHLGPGFPPARMFYGSEDPYLPPAQAFADRAQELSLPVQLDVFDGQAHGFFNNDPWFKRTLHRADRFLAGLGYLDGPPTFAAP